MITVHIRPAIKVNGDEALFVSFPYDNRIVEVIRSFPTRYWDKESKEWELPVNKLGSLVEQLQDFDFELKGLHSLEKKSISIPAGFEFKTTPFSHQEDGFMFGLENDRWLLGDEQGLGKTKQVIDIAVARKKPNTHCLIVCGVNGLKWNWLNEISTHSNEKGFILGQKIKAGNITIGSNKDKLASVSLDLAANSYFWITNVETLRDEKIQAKLNELCVSGAISIVAIDEIHKCKDPSSQQGKGILKLQSDVRIAMTGTPLMNTPLDLFIILKWLGYEKHSFYAFKKHYCQMGGYGNYQIVGYKNLEELEEMLDEMMLRRLKQDVLDLPEKLYIDEYVEMTNKQAVIYKEITNEIKSNIDMIKTAPNPLAELIRMRQATGYTGILSSKIQESAKLDRMEELVEEAIENGKKVVIFSNWTQMTTPIFQRLVGKGYKGTLITGETKDTNRQASVNAFQNSDEIQFIVGTIGAIGTGLTLTAGTVEIFMDEPWTMAAKAQAEDRCHRIGANENVTIYTLMCKNTIDERIHDIVLEKGALSDAIVDGKANPSKLEMLDFLLS